VIGDDTAVPFDTKTSTGFEFSVVLHTWSQKRGKKEIKEMQGAIYDLLHLSTIAVAGYDTVMCEFEFEESFLEDDGVTRHGVQRFNLTFDVPD
jgi:hypothetical protein